MRPNAHPTVPLRYFWALRVVEMTWAGVAGEGGACPPPTAVAALSLAVHILRAPPKTSEAASTALQMSKPIGPIAQAWYKWKALRLPWRKRFLMGKFVKPAFGSEGRNLHHTGYDLEGNTYWEFRLTRGAGGNERWRRIVNYPRSTHLSEVKVSPLWHQWLRYTRQDPPSVSEQQGDVVRQARMKTLAAQADARWEAKPKMMDAPGGPAGQSAPMLESRGAQQEVTASGAETTTLKTPTEDKAAKSHDPWARAKAQGPSENWQPAAWSPTSTRKR